MFVEMHKQAACYRSGNAGLQGCHLFQCDPRLPTRFACFGFRVNLCLFKKCLFTYTEMIWTMFSFFANTSLVSMNYWKCIVSSKTLISESCLGANCVVGGRLYRFLEINLLVIRCYWCRFDTRCFSRSDETAD